MGDDAQNEGETVIRVAYMSTAKATRRIVRLAIVSGRLIVLIAKADERLEGLQISRMACWTIVYQ